MVLLSFQSILLFWPTLFRSGHRGLVACGKLYNFGAFFPQSLFLLHLGIFGANAHRSFLINMRLHDLVSMAVRLVVTLSVSEQSLVVI